MVNNPNIRFAGFSDEWEERKLGDFLKTPKKVKAQIQSKDDLMTLKLNLGGLKTGSNRQTLDLGSTIYYKRKAGQFIYGKQNFFNGSMAIIPIDLDGKATSGDVPSLDVVGILSEYLYGYVSRGDYWKSKESEASGTGSKRIHEKTLQGFDINVPSTQNEQRKIGSFFKQLDDTIAHHQRKLDLMKNLKKGYLQKMFPKNGATEPEIRFKGFTDAWEQRKLGDFVVDYVEKTTIQNQYPVLTSSQQKGIVLQEDYFANRQVTTDKNIGYFVLPMGYFTFRSRSDNDVFVFNRNDLIDKGIISYFYPVFTLKDADSDFFLKRINNGIQQQIAIAAEGTGQHVLSLKKFKNIIAIFPCLEEQEKIGSFFKQLDDTIAFHQRKLDLMKDLKKGLSQQMFV